MEGHRYTSRTSRYCHPESKCQITEFPGNLLTRGSSDWNTESTNGCIPPDLGGGGKGGGGNGANQDRRVIACNYVRGTSACAAGALCYYGMLRPFYPGSGAARILIVARSRSGRWIQKTERLDQLGNFRLKTLPPEHPMYGDARVGDANSATIEMVLERYREATHE